MSWGCAKVISTNTLFQKKIHLDLFCRCFLLNCSLHQKRKVALFPNRGGFKGRSTLQGWCQRQFHTPGVVSEVVPPSRGGVRGSSTLQGWCQRQFHTPGVVLEVVPHSRGSVRGSSTLQGWFCRVISIWISRVF